MVFMQNKPGMLSAKSAGDLFFLLVLVQLVGTLAYGAAGFFIPELYGFEISTLYSQALMLVPTLLTAACLRMNWREIFPLRRIHLGQTVLALLMTAAAFPAGNLLNVLSSMLTGNTVEQMSGEIVRSPMWEMVLLIGLIGPFCEELVFRGYLFQNLKRGNRAVSAAVLSGLLFGLFHLNFNQFVYAAGMGILFALAADAGGSLWVPVLMHQAFNTAEVWMLYLPGRNARNAGEAAARAGAGAASLERFSVSLPEMARSVLWAAVGLWMFSLLLKQMRKISRISAEEGREADRPKETEAAEDNMQRKEPEEKEKRLRFSGLGMAGIVIAAAYMIFAELFLY